MLKTLLTQFSKILHVHMCVVLQTPQVWLILEKFMPVAYVINIHSQTFEMERI